MTGVTLEYEIAVGTGDEVRLLHNRISETLEAVAETGSMAGAAKKLGYSYRQVWNLVNGWEATFGVQFLNRGKGHTGELTPAARRWLSAEKEVFAEYAETLTALRADLERSFALAVNGDMPLIRLAGCPDGALELLRQNALKRSCVLEINFTSSLQGLQELAAGGCEIAGFNFPLGVNTKTSLPREFRKFFDGGALAMIGFATRIQGMAVAPGNPLGLYSMLNVSTKKVRYVNRAPGTGTRILCDALLRSAGIRPDEVSGYGVVAASHQAVATQVKLGKADAGLCIESVADSVGTDFIPLVKEAYFLACRKDFLETAPGQRFMDALKNGCWREKAASLKGYDFEMLGKMM